MSNSQLEARIKALEAELAATREVVAEKVSDLKQVVGLLEAIPESIRNQFWICLRREIAEQFLEVKGFYLEEVK